MKAKTYNPRLAILADDITTTGAIETQPLHKCPAHHLAKKSSLIVIIDLQFFGYNYHTVARFPNNRTCVPPVS